MLVEELIQELQKYDPLVEVKMDWGPVCRVIKEPGKRHPMLMSMPDVRLRGDSGPTLKIDEQ